MLKHLQTMLTYSRNSFHIFFHLSFVKILKIFIKNEMASSFKTKTDPSQAMKQTGVLNFRRPLLQVSDIQITIKHVVKNFPPIPRFRF